MVKFGPSGNSESFYAEGFKSTLEAAKWVKDKGLDAFEYSFGKGYILSSETAKTIGEEFKKQEIALSVHAPYFINFANPSEEMYEKTKGYIRTGIKFLRLMGANRLVFHPASCGKMKREEAVELTYNRLKEFMAELEEKNLLDGIYLCPETMGKSMQIGTYKEIIDFCTINSHLIPTFDFGHINALTQGSLKSSKDYEEIINYSIEKLGFERTSIAHVHFSKIEFGPKGEIKHLNFDQNEFGPEFSDFAKVLVEKKLDMRIICESAGHQAEDALQMKNIYKSLLN